MGNAWLRYLQLLQTSHRKHLYILATASQFTIGKRFAIAPLIARQRLKEFIPADPLRGLRRRADLQRLRRFPAQLARIESGGRVKLWWNREGEEFALWLDMARDRAALAAIERCLADPSAPLPELDPRWLSEPIEWSRA